MKDNEYLVSGYRIGYTKHSQLVRSACSCHNETVNIWTHLIGAISFLALSLIIWAFFRNSELIGGQGQEYYLNQLTKEMALGVDNYDISDYLGMKLKVMKSDVEDAHNKYLSEYHDQQDGFEDFAQFYLDKVERQAYLVVK